MENALTIAEPVLQTAEDAVLARLVRQFEEAEEATRSAREKSERDRDYYDNKQLTQEEHDELEKRGQPPISFNVIKSRVEFLQGIEKKQRRDPKAWPRNPQDSNAADAYTDGMRYAVLRADYETARSNAWKNITVEGFGGIEGWVEPARDGNYNIKMKRIPWDRLFYDPHSVEADFSDATYLGQVLWLDEAAAVLRYGEDVRGIITTALSPTTISETYDDKPKWTQWADRKRKRVRIVVMWDLGPEGWTCYDFTKASIITETPGPYLDEEGESYCPLILESAHVDRDNNRYGEVRALIDPQDEINKRRSKALWLVTTRGVIAEEGAVADKEKTRRELARPDFYIEKAPDAQFEIVNSGDLAAGQAQLGQQAMAYVMQSGPNAALLGKGTEDQSGRAIEAQQAGGMIEQGDIMDTLRRLDQRAFRMVANMMKQWWPAQKWINVTDDELAPKWVGFNVPLWVDQQTGETGTEQDWQEKIAAGAQPMLAPDIDPETGEQRLSNDLARLDMDIILSDAPDMVTLDGETYGALMQVLSSGMPPPMMRLAIELHPGLNTKRKKQALDMLEQMAAPQQPDPMAEQAQGMAMERAQAETEEIKARAFKHVAQGEQAAAKAQEPAPLQFAY